MDPRISSSGRYFLQTGHDAARMYRIGRDALRAETQVQTERTQRVGAFCLAVEG
jgi:hypothetical protein